MLSIILHYTSTNVCDIDINSCILFFNLYICTFLLMLLEYYTIFYIFIVDIEY